VKYFSGQQQLTTVKDYYSRDMAFQKPDYIHYNPLAEHLPAGRLATG
jgi:hypothetical protein